MESSRTPESQQASIKAPAPGDALNGVRMLVRPLSWSFTGTRRICRCSLMFEAYILSNIVEQGLQTRAVVFDALKQFTWDNRDVRDEEVNGPMTCCSPWVDTPGTLSDYPSKKKTSQRIGNTSSTNIFDTRPNEKNPLTRSGEDREKEQERPHVSWRRRSKMVATTGLPSTFWSRQRTTETAESVGASLRIVVQLHACFRCCFSAAEVLGVRSFSAQCMSRFRRQFQRVIRFFKKKSNNTRAKIQCRFCPAWSRHTGSCSQKCRPSIFQIQPVCFSFWRDATEKHRETVLRSQALGLTREQRRTKRMPTSEFLTATTKTWTVSALTSCNETLA